MINEDEHGATRESGKLLAVYWNWRIGRLRVRGQG